MVRVASRLLQEAKEATIPTKFSETNKLHFEDLPNLRSLSSGETIELPSLEHVIVNHCPNLKKFGLGTIKSSQLKSLILDDQVQVEDNIDTKIAHIFEFLDPFSTIVDYIIGDSKELSKAIDNIRPSHFTNLQLLSAKSCDEGINKFLSILIKRSKKLEIIDIEKCKTLEHLFDLEELMPDEDGHGKYFPMIKRLSLTELHQLACIWNKDPTGIFVLENLQIMHIKRWS
ncbi:uncharacterized protein LOC114916427 [Cajanus cajan]|uniref:uncharacterized protein LOC114916427 n=1 Tax=Cajanus cajan TaxID=3821 RepID=UPI0010FB5BF4|nr:uncharacterized protein LOC114916427 [Cajanus cajan]